MGVEVDVSPLLARGMMAPSSSTSIRPRRKVWSLPPCRPASVERKPWIERPCPQGSSSRKWFVERPYMCDVMIIVRRSGSPEVRVHESHSLWPLNVRHSRKSRRPTQQKVPVPVYLLNRALCSPPTLISRPKKEKKDHEKRNAGSLSRESCWRTGTARLYAVEKRLLGVTFNRPIHGTEYSRAIYPSGILLKPILSVRDNPRTIAIYYSSHSRRNTFSVH